jgi:hypothetical protein
MGHLSLVISDYMISRNSLSISTMKTLFYPNHPKHRRVQLSGSWRNPLSIFTDQTILDGACFNNHYNAQNAKYLLCDIL